MNILDAIDGVIVRHLGSSDFGKDKTPLFWAKLILESDLNDTLTFGQSLDTLSVEELQRTVRKAQKELKNLSYATRNFKPSAFAVWYHTNVIMGQRHDVWVEAEAALANLQDWLIGLREHSSFKKQAGSARNWRAASVAVNARLLWATAHWELQGNVRPKFNLNALAWPNGIRPHESEEDILLQTRYLAFLRNYSPTSEKHEKPGPFGRFLEELFEYLGIESADGRPFPAASALRSVNAASKQKQ